MQATKEYYNPGFEQIESVAERVKGNSQVNRTTTIDSTVGKDTFFVVTWQINTPTITLYDPMGKKYTIEEFDVDPVFYTARLQIPGIAQVIVNYRYSLQLLQSESIFGRKS